MCRVLKVNGEMVISELHPYAIEFKNARTVFYYKKKKYRIKNYVYLFEDLFKIFKNNKLEIVEIKEPKVTKKCLDIYIELCRKYGRIISKEREYKE
jgi:hypothetical protein